MADTGVVDLDTDLVGLGGSDLDVLDGQVLAGLPGDGGLAGDGLFSVDSSVTDDVISHRPASSAQSSRGRLSLARSLSSPITPPDNVSVCKLTLPTVEAIVPLV